YPNCEIVIPAEPSGTRTVTVTFDKVGAAATQPLTVSTSGDGSVTSSPAGIACGSTCTASFAQDQAVTLTATPAQGYALSGWGGCYVVTGNQCTVTISAAATVSASFLPVYTLTVAEAGTGGGSVLGRGISCPATCTGVYDSGAQVTLDANSDASSTLTGWSGCDSSSVTAKTCTVTLGADRTVTANFTHNPSWMLDPAFGTGGTVVTAGGTDVTSMAVEPNGDIVAVGTGTLADGTPATYIVRYTSTGQLDTSFGSGGVVTIAESGSATDPITAGKFLGDGVAIQPNGEIVVAGSLYPGGALNPDFSMVRLSAGGGLDTSLGSGGVVDTPITGGSSGAVAVLVDPSTGDIFLGGEGGSTNEFALTGYDSTGALLLSFGSSGTVLTPVGAGGAFMTSMIWDNGDIVALGHAFNAASQEEGAVAAYTQSGATDSYFNGGNPLLTLMGTSGSAWVMGAAVQNSNQLVLVAGWADYGGQDCIGLMRLNADGSVDTGFGNGGYTDVCPNGTISNGTGVAVDSAGTIYVAGYLDGSSSRPVLLHFSDAGALDPSFGSGGAIITSPNGSYPAGAGPIVLDGTNEVVVGGFVDSTQSGSPPAPGTPVFFLQGFSYK
ncbi:MAG: InlB B-repeat-containing protein, partial [Solirubrobacteraceae bacterium]